MGNGKGGDMTAPDPMRASDSVTILRKAVFILKTEGEVEVNKLYTLSFLIYVSPLRTWAEP